MSDEYTDGRTKGFNTSMFFNDTIDDVKKQMNFCGQVDYGEQFKLIYGKNIATTKYHNIYFSFLDTILTFAIDCKH